MGLPIVFIVCLRQLRPAALLTECSVVQKGLKKVGPRVHFHGNVKGKISSEVFFKEGWSLLRFLFFFSFGVSLYS